MAERTAIRCSAPSHALAVERTESSRSDKAHQWPTVAPLGSTQNVRLHIFRDQSVIEVFTDEGRTVLASRIYPARQDSVYVGIAGSGRTAVVHTLSVWEMDPVWETQ